MITLNINDIYGVSSYITKDSIRIKFRCPLPHESWHVLLKSIHELIEEDLLNWEFDLTELEHPCSTDIGMWVTLNNKIVNQGGTLHFIVGHDSCAHKYMKLTKLDKMFSITAQDPNQDTFEDKYA